MDFKSCDGGPRLDTGVTCLGQVSAAGGSPGCLGTYVESMTGTGLLLWRVLALPLVTGGTDGADSFDINEIKWIAGLMLLGFVATGALVLAFRRGYIAKRPADSPEAPAKRQDTEGDTFVRSVLALWLVIGLMVITVASFGLADENLRSTLVGAVAASAGGAIAFYFSSKAASEARRDLLASAGDGQVEVPKIVGLTVASARELFAEHASLGLDAGAFADDDVVAKQSPPPTDRVQRGTLVIVVEARPKPAQKPKPKKTAGGATTAEPAAPEPAAPPATAPSG